MLHYHDDDDVFPLWFTHAHIEPSTLYFFWFFVKKIPMWTVCCLCRCGYYFVFYYVVCVCVFILFFSPLFLYCLSKYSWTYFVNNNSNNKSTKNIHLLERTFAINKTNGMNENGKRIRKKSFWYVHVHIYRKNIPWDESCRLFYIEVFFSVCIYAWNTYTHSFHSVRLFLMRLWHVFPEKKTRGLFGICITR